MRLFKTLVAALAVTYAVGAVADDGFKVGDTSIKFNGFAEAALFYQFSGGFHSLAGGCDYYICPQSIALSSGSQPVAQEAMTVAYSRFGISTSTPSGVGAVGTRFEVDAANSYQTEGKSFTHHDMIRLRHAYGTVGDWLLLGQTWSTFADLNTFPDQMDENPFVNLAALRAPMIRVAIPAGPVKVSIALEDPYAETLSGQTWNIPDVIAKVEINAGPASISLRGVGKQYKVPTASTAGFGGAIGVALKLGDDALVIDAEGGPGIGTYMYGTTAVGDDAGKQIGEDAVLNSKDPTTIDLWTVYGASVGYTHSWTGNVRSNLMASGMWTASNTTIQNDVTTAVYNFQNKAVYSVGINTYWSPAKSFWVGPEFYWHHRDTFGAGSGNEVQGELVSHFNFL